MVASSNDGRGCSTTRSNLSGNHLRDQARDDPTLGMLLVVGRDDVTVEVALRSVSTPFAVIEWRPRLLRSARHSPLPKTSGPP